MLRHTSEKNTAQTNTKRLFSIALATILLLAIIFAQVAYAADTYCPKGRYCTSPGCHEWADDNGNGVCDVAEGPDATLSADTASDADVGTTADASSEADTDSETAAAGESNTSTAAASEETETTVAGEEEAGVIASFVKTLSESPLILVYAGFLAVAAILSKLSLSKKRRNLIRGVLLVLSVVILGFYFGGCICPIGGLQNLPLKLSGIGEGYYLGWLLIMLLPLLFVFFSGRIFCSSVCPMGAVQELLFSAGRKLGLNKGRPGLENVKWLRFVKYGVLLWLVVYTAITGYTLFCGNDPFLTLFTFQGTLVSVILLIFVVISSLFVSRLWCRVICPYGALLAVINGIAAALRLPATPAGEALRCKTCSACGLCTRDCPVDAIVFAKSAGGESCMEIDPLECINCRKCVDK